MNSVIRSAPILLLFAVAACASAPAGGSEGRNVLTAEQLVASRANNVYEAIELLRPAWLTSRGPQSMTNSTPAEASVFMNGIRVGGLEHLKTVTIAEVAQVRYFPASEAIGRFGMGHPRGVLEVINKGT